MIQGITNWQLGLNVLTEFIVGYMLPGRPMAMMLFKTYGYITMAQALYFTQDMKLGHYIKVPVCPRLTPYGSKNLHDLTNPALASRHFYGADHRLSLVLHRPSGCFQLGLGHDPKNL
jgi:hypothetical protein